MSPGTTYMTIHRNTDRKTAYIDTSEIAKSVSNDWQMTEGVPLRNSLREAATLRLASGRGDMLCDFVPNLSMALILSEPAVELLRAEGVAADEVIEYLPITLLDKRGRPTRVRYYLVNPLLKVACMDAKASEFLKSSGGEKVLSVERLVLEQERIPSDAKLFRLDECTEVIVIRSDLVQRIQEAGLTGLVVKAQGEDIY
ncbi:imm11 family protein [Pyxidicoccus sp. 3LG]